MDTIHLRPPSAARARSPTISSRFTAALPEEMPYHWRKEFLKSWPWTRPTLAWIWGWLCSITVGQSTLEEAWACMRTSEADFQEYMNRMVSRLSNMTIIAGLFLGSITTMFTASPPQPEMFNFNIRETYLLTGCSFGILMGGLLVGFGVMHVMGTCTRRWVTEVLCATRGRVWCTLILLSYPFLSFIVATYCLMAGFFIAQIQSNDLVVKIGSIFLYIVPFSLFIPAAILSKPPSSVRRQHREAEAARARAEREQHDHKGEA